MSIETDLMLAGSSLLVQQRSDFSAKLIEYFEAHDSGLRHLKRDGGRRIEGDDGVGERAVASGLEVEHHRQVISFA